ncbi:Fic family protein [Bacillus sp. Au-Bac7]|uniref:Fic family protein n=1 Tax=Bacillus sp. Au-Bac7 TaxID=2906458 RepID=UPI001E63E95E|nr:Fic family protein [Bacillus sp. Au-Bac7]MCE4051664.1 Fic family protein [Bacillus sp. Au-Bac7]
MQYFSTNDAFEIVKAEGLLSNIQVFRRYLQDDQIPGAFQLSKKEGWKIPEDSLYHFLIKRKGKENIQTNFIQRSFYRLKEELPEEYVQDVLVRLAHHSSALEGNSISLADTVSIILYGKVPRALDKRELLEVDNHIEAWELVLDSVQREEPLDINKILAIHERLMNKLLQDKGAFKTLDNRIVGADFQTTSFQQTPYFMKQWVDNVSWMLPKASSKTEIIRMVGNFHIQFERIHPFSDGNGRTGRLLMNYSLVQNGIVPLILEGNDRATYIDILSTQDMDNFMELAMPLIEKEEARLKKFQQKEKMKIELNDS